MAETIFNFLSKNPRNKAESAGLLLDEKRDYVNENVLKILSEKGYIIKNIKPTQATRGYTEKFDILIILSEGIEKEFFKNIVKKVEKWEIKDCDKSDSDCIEKEINKIESNIKLLLNNL